MKVLAVPRYQMFRYITWGCDVCDGYCDHSGFFNNNNLISINDSVLLLDEYGLEAPNKSCLSLIFADAEPRGWDERYQTHIEESGLILFDEDHAKQIIDFVNKMDKSKDLYVHCTAGICRSGAVAEFIATEMLGIDYQDFFELNKQIMPNRHVSKILRKVWLGGDIYAGS